MSSKEVAICILCGLFVYASDVDGSYGWYCDDQRRQRNPQRGRSHLVPTSCTSGRGQARHCTSAVPSCDHQIQVQHPAAKSMIEISRTQDEEVGDGTTSVIILGEFQILLF